MSVTNASALFKVHLGGLGGTVNIWFLTFKPNKKWIFEQVIILCQKGKLKDKGRQRSNYLLDTKALKMPLFNYLLLIG